MYFETCAPLSRQIRSTSEFRRTFWPFDINQKLLPIKFSKIFASEFLTYNKNTSKSYENCRNEFDRYM